MPDRPTVERVLYDALLDIKGTVDRIAGHQSQQAIELASTTSEVRQAARTFDQQTKINEAVRKELDDMSDRVDGLARVSWLMTIIGGFVVAIAIGVSTDALNKWMDRRTAPAAQQIQPGSVQ